MKARYGHGTTMLATTTRRLWPVATVAALGLAGVVFGLPRLQRWQAEREVGRAANDVQECLAAKDERSIREHLLEVDRGESRDGDWPQKCRQPLARLGGALPQAWPKGTLTCHDAPCPSVSTIEKQLELLMKLLEAGYVTDDAVMNLLETLARGGVIKASKPVPPSAKLPLPFVQSHSNRDLAVDGQGRAILSFLDPGSQFRVCDLRLISAVITCQAAHPDVPVFDPDPLLLRGGQAPLLLTRDSHDKGPNSVYDLSTGTIIAHYAARPWAAWVDATTIYALSRTSDRRRLTLTRHPLTLTKSPTAPASTPLRLAAPLSARASRSEPSETDQATAAGPWVIDGTVWWLNQGELWVLDGIGSDGAGSDGLQIRIRSAGEVAFAAAPKGAGNSVRGLSCATDSLVALWLSDGNSGLGTLAVGTRSSAPKIDALALHKVEVPTESAALGCFKKVATVGWSRNQGSDAIGAQHYEPGSRPVETKHKLLRQACDTTGCTSDSTEISIVRHSASSRFSFGMVDNSWLTVWRSPLGDVRFGSKTTASSGPLRPRAVFDDEGFDGFEAGPVTLVTADRYGVLLVGDGKARSTRGWVLRPDTDAVPIRIGPPGAP